VESSSRSTTACCVFNEYVQANIQFLTIIKFLLTVYVIMEKKNILAYFSDFSLKAECLFFFFALVVKKREYIIK
jgi:exosortase/archaeosortase